MLLLQLLGCYTHFKQYDLKVADVAIVAIVAIATNILI